MSSAMTREFSDANLTSEVLEAKAPVLVDFWAPWCGPCRAMAPAVDQLAAGFAGRAVVGKMNVDQNHEVPARYGIQAIPTLLVFKDGKLVERIVGAGPKTRIEAALARQLDAAGAQAAAQ